MHRVLIMVRIDLKINYIYLFHLADVLAIMEDQIDESKLTLDCKGGGRIRVNPQTRTISVYGYSMVSNSFLEFSLEYI